jgi:hypothetical protein
MLAVPVRVPESDGVPVRVAVRDGVGVPVPVGVPVRVPEPVPVMLPDSDPVPEMLPVPVGEAVRDIDGVGDRVGVRDPVGDGLADGSASAGSNAATATPRNSIPAGAATTIEHPAIGIPESYRQSPAVVVRYRTYDPSVLPVRPNGSAPDGPHRTPTVSRQAPPEKLQANRFAPVALRASATQMRCPV